MQFRGLTLVLILGATGVTAQTVRSGQDLPKFMGRELTVVTPALDDDGFFPKGPASVCVEAPPRRQCYAPADAYGKEPAVEVVQVTKDVSALFFSAASGGVSGWMIHFALLVPGPNNGLVNLFPSDIPVSNQNEHGFWSNVEISDAQIFVTADAVWGPDESHYGEHRYIISAYVVRPSSSGDDIHYYLEDRYMTTRKYLWDRNVDILASENQEILNRLKRAKAEAKRQ